MLGEWVLLEIKCSLKRDWVAYVCPATDLSHPLPRSTFLENSPRWHSDPCSKKGASTIWIFSVSSFLLKLGLGIIVYCCFHAFKVQVSFFHWLLFGSLWSIPTYQLGIEYQDPSLHPRSLMLANVMWPRSTRHSLMVLSWAMRFMGMDLKTLSQRESFVLVKSALLVVQSLSPTLAPS